MVRLPKIAIGTQKRKSHFDLTHDVTTTSDFGFCQPTVVRHLNAKSKSTLQTSVGVRLSALPTPTFGRIRLKTYNAFVPIQEVFEAFDYMQARKSVASVFGDYVPQSADKITIQQLLNVIYSYSWAQWSKLYDDNGNIVPDADLNPFLNFNILCPSLKSSNVNWNFSETRARFNDYTLVSPSTLFNNVNDEYHASADDNIFAEFRQAIALRNGGGSSASQYVDVSKLSDLYIDNFNDDTVTAELFDMFEDRTTNINAFLGQKEYMLNPVKRSFIGTRGSESSYDMWQKSFDVSITKTIDGEEKTLLVPCLLTCNWTKYGQRLLKVLTACGVRGFEYLDDVVDLDKLFAYYKAWFDIMNPGRTRQWRETPCYKLIHTYYDDPTDIYTLMSRDEAGHDGTVAINAFVSFLIDLTNCCYVLPIDNFTAATPQPLLNLNSINSTSLNIGSDGINPVLSKGDNTLSNYPHFDGAGVTLNGLLIDGLLKLYKLANKNSVIGSRIEDYLRTKFGYSVERSNILQSSEMVVKIEEMFATNTNEFNYLGELGGRGSKDNAGTNKITFEAPTFGIFVQFMCVVPFGDYVQGNIKPKLTVNDWYQEVYDSLGKEALSLSEILARSSDMSIGRVDTSFGFVPMYWRDKVQNSMHNGAFALPSQRDVLLPYSLDRLFNEHYKMKVINNGEVDWDDVDASVITPSEELRYIGRTPDFGSYDRIFFDNTGYMDNFILHIIEQWDYYADMKPISQSFETYDDNDDSTTTVTAS